MDCFRRCTLPKRLAHSLGDKSESWRIAEITINPETAANADFRLLNAIGEYDASKQGNRQQELTIDELTI
jgi:hypothetical protein